MTTAKYERGKGVSENMLEEAIRFGRKLGQYGLIDGSGGNLSFRTPRGLVITKAGVLLDELTPEDFVELDLEWTHPQASSDLLVHQLIYRDQDTQYRVVVHGHGVYNVLLSLDRWELVPVDLEGKVVLEKVQIVEGEFRSEELAGKTAREVTDRGLAVVRGHGFYAAGVDFREAFNRAVFLEHSCKILFLQQLLSRSEEQRGGNAGGGAEFAKEIGEVEGKTQAGP